MKLKIFDITNAPKANPKGRPILHVNASGMFTIGSFMAQQLGLKAGDIIKLAQDEASPKDWYLIKSPNNKDGFQLRTKSGDSLVFNSSGMASLIFASVGFKGKSGRILLGSEPIQQEDIVLFPLITSSLKSAA